MSKQEEIKEGLREHLKRFYIRCFGKEPEDMALDYLEHCLKNQEIWLASQGVVIKVDRECLPQTLSIPHKDYLFPDDETVEIITIDLATVRALEYMGCVAIEPLIREVPSGV